MNYRIVLARSFKISVRQLERRFRSVKSDVKLAIKVLEQNPDLGVVIPSASGIRKLRVRNSDLSRGKSGGYRLLYWISNHDDPINYLLLLYFNGDQDDISRAELQKLLDDLAAEDYRSADNP